MEKTKLEANDEEDLDPNDILKLLLNCVSEIAELETKIQSLENIISESKEINQTLIQLNTNDNLSENILQNVEFLSELELSLMELANVLKNTEESRLELIQKFENMTYSLQEESKDEFLQYHEDSSDENELSDNTVS